MVAGNENMETDGVSTHQVGKSVSILHSASLRRCGQWGIFCSLDWTSDVSAHSHAANVEGVK